ncbi:choice-of-anchor L domain-containing protein, partial [Flavobacterium sp.]|uniref:choice-of-anchor L domain-containing protein n=1 Tax=Flavobacterium sp. TaxID=239 RepID=UPI003D6A7D1C
MKKLYLLTFLLFGLTTQAQLQLANIYVDPGGTVPPFYFPTKTPAQIVSQDLVGIGVTPYNITFNGTAAGASTFSRQVDRFSTSNNLTSLGFLPDFNPSGVRIAGTPNGMLMTTGESSVALGPNNNAGKSIVVDEAPAGDPDLQKITTNDVDKVSIVEFDFVATGPTLNFDFIFASEEYPEYTDDPNFNDVFGFFLSGPGIVPDVIAPDTGPSFTNNARNIARVPGTSTAVSIGTVHNGETNTGPCVNCSYYVANGIGITPAVNSSIQYDGFTSVIRATSELQCGQVYHIKLAIANVGDTAFDSAVFLKNFQIPPMALSVVGGADEIIACEGDPAVTISSGVTAGTNVFEWYLDGVLIPGATGPTLDVATTGVYKLIAHSSGGCLIGEDTINASFYHIPLLDPEPVTICTTGTGPYNFIIDQNAYILDGLNPLDYPITYFTSYANAYANVSPIPNGILGAYPSAGAGELIWVKIEDPYTTGCTNYRSFPLNAVSSPAGTFSYASPYCSSLSTPQLPTLTGLTPGGAYTATPAGLTIDATTGAVTPST